MSSQPTSPSLRIAPITREQVSVAILILIDLELSVTLGWTMIEHLQANKILFPRTWKQNIGMLVNISVMCYGSRATMAFLCHMYKDAEKYTLWKRKKFFLPVTENIVLIKAYLISVFNGTYSLVKKTQWQGEFRGLWTQVRQSLPEYFTGKLRTHWGVNGNEAKICVKDFPKRQNNR